MLRKIDELISELDARIEQQNAIISRSQFEPEEMIFTQRRKCIAQMGYLVDMKENGYEYFNTDDFDVIEGSEQDGI